MVISIRKMNPKDQDLVLEMMRNFYSSPAVFTDGSEEIFLRDIENCTGSNPFVEGYILETEGIAAGYAMVAKSYSTEFGKPCIWIEDLYIRDDFRGMGLGKQFFVFLSNQFHDCIFRLEVESDNLPALRLYEKCGFTQLPYMEMKK